MSQTNIETREDNPWPRAVTEHNVTKLPRRRRRWRLGGLRFPFDGDDLQVVLQLLGFLTVVVVIFSAIGLGVRLFLVISGLGGR